MIVVSDTSAVSNLLHIGQEDLLPALFERVLIPRAVLQELRAAHPSLPPWLDVRTVSNEQRVTDLRGRVHPGEAEALVLAAEVHADWVLVDAGDGRKLARELGLPVLGLMGVLLLAKRQGLLQEVRPWMDRLQEEAAFFLSPSVRAEVLRLAGEADA